MQQQINLVHGINKKDLADIKTAREEGAFALDSDGRLLSINRQAEKLLGFSARELAGRDVFSVINFKLGAVATLGGTECAALSSVSCSHLHKGATIVRGNGDTLAIMFVSMPVFDNGKVVGKIYIFKEFRDFRILEEQYRSIIEGAGSIIVKLDSTGQVVFANEYAREVFGEVLDLRLPSKVVLALQHDPQTLDSFMRLRKRCRARNGERITIAWTVRTLTGIDGRVVGAVCVGNDVSQGRNPPTPVPESSQLLLPDKALTQKVLDHISDGVITIDKEGLVEYLNPVAERLTGWACHEAKCLQLREVYQVVDEKTREPKVAEILLRSQDERGVRHGVPSLLLRRDGWEFNIEESATAIRDHKGEIAGAVIVFRDVTNMQGMEPWMKYETTHDALTGLANRREFELRLIQAIGSARTEGRQHALLTIDIAGFAKINNRHSSEAGDEVLRQVASLLHLKVRDTDVLARLGNDDFCVLLKNCSLSNADENANGLCEGIGDHKFHWDKEIIDVSVSAGVIPITADSGGLADVMRIADAACYVAKDKGRNRVHVYRPHDVAIKQRHGELQWVQRIRRAIEENRFRLYCQSIVPLDQPESKAVHHEILLRLLDEGGDVLSPATFLSAAENYNLMPSIDRWVIKNALKLLGERIQRQPNIGLFAINLSAQSLDTDNFLGFVIDQIDKSQVPAANLCFEITESTAISNLMTATRFMSVLRGMGCRFALDDFGRGFSSYSYLKHLNVDYLKIDGSFIRDVAHDPVDHAMVDSINQIGHIMGVQTIAEFVDSEEALEKLMALGVDHVQGFQLGKPRPMWHSFQAQKSVQPEVID